MRGQYFTYIITNQTKTTLYVGMTNSLETRLTEHYQNKGNRKTYAGRYYCYYLLWFETFDKPMDAIHREKEIKKWRREKKEALIKETNPEFQFLNADIMEWPPKEWIDSTR